METLGHSTQASGGDQHESTVSSVPFRRIAVCVDGSVQMADAVVHHAAMTAEAFSAPLTILRVLEPDQRANGVPPDPLDWDVRQREAHAHLDQLVALARQRAIDVSTELLQGRPAEQICQWAWQHHADLVVLASHGEHGRSAWTLSSTARKLVDGVPGSLLLVPADGAPDTGSLPGYRRIMVPLDGSPRAESVLPIAVRLATAHRADVLVAHITAAPELATVSPLTADDRDLEQRIVARNERVMRGYLDQIRARMVNAGVAARTVIARAGDARTRLARLVRREGIDLVVLSAYGRRGPRDTPCGSVTAHLVTHATTPMLVFRERPRRVLERLSEVTRPHAATVRPPVQAVA
jgi:nucleotide-binding universal stress UspA family protein